MQKNDCKFALWLKQDNAPSISAIAKAVGKHRNTVRHFSGEGFLRKDASQTWLSKYRDGGVEVMLKFKKSPGGVRVIPQWAEAALAKRLQDQHHGFKSYYEVQQWLAETLGVKAKYHAVYQMTHYRLKAKLKVAPIRHYKQDNEQLEVFKKTLLTTSNC